MVPREAVGDLVVRKYFSDGSWAGLSRCCVFTATHLSAQDPFASLRRPERFWSLPTPTEHISRRDPTVNAVLRSPSTLAPLARQSNKLLQSVTALLIPYVRYHFSSDHDLVPNCSRVFCRGQKRHLDMRSRRLQTWTRWFSSDRAEPPHIPTRHADNGHGYPSLPSPTIHRLILLRQGRHRHCEGPSLCTRARTSG